MKKISFLIAFFLFVSCKISLSSPIINDLNIVIDKSDYTSGYVVGVEAYVSSENTISGVEATHNSITSYSLGTWDLDYKGGNRWWNWAEGRRGLYSDGPIDGSISVTAYDKTGYSKFEVGIPIDLELDFIQNYEISKTTLGYSMSADEVVGAEIYKFWVWDPVDRYYIYSMTETSLSNFDIVSFENMVAGRGYNYYLLSQLHGISTKKTKKPSEYEHTTEKQKNAPQRSVDAMVPSAVENENTTEDPFDFLDRWAMAWSAQDVNGYLSFYSQDFVPAANISLENWKKQRHNRLTETGIIEVFLTNFDRRPSSDDKIQVEAIQYYRSNIYSDRTHKLFDLQRSGSSWEILRERSLATTQASHY